VENFTAQQPMPTTEMLPDGPSKRFAIVLTRALARIWARIARMPFNNSETVSASDTGTADTEFSITHHLGAAGISRAQYRQGRCRLRFGHHLDGHQDLSQVQCRQRSGIIARLLRGMNDGFVFIQDESKDTGATLANPGAG